MTKRRSKRKAKARAAMPSGIEISTSALKSFRRSGVRAPDGPTPERLLKAGGHARVENFSEVVEVSKGDNFEPVAVSMIRMRIEDSPFERMCARKQLAPKDPALNLILARAGIQYREARAKAGLEGIKSVDFGRVGHGGSGGLLTTEAQCQAFQVFNGALKSMSPICQKVVGAIVLDDRTAVDIGREISAYTHPISATAIGMYVLQIGLAAMARHFGLLAAAAIGTVPAEIAMSEGHAAGCGL